MERNIQIAGVASLLAVLAIAAGCHRELPGSPADQTLVVPVQLPLEREIVDYAYFTGRTESPESVELRARVTGYLVMWKYERDKADAPYKEFNFVPGQEVKTYQVLFKIDPRPYKATYDQAQAQVDLAQARLKLANADYARAVDVAKTPGAISQQDVDKYAAAQAEAAAELEAAQANKEAARLNLEYTDVISPINGVVSRNLLSVGNLVRADDTLLTTIVSEDPMYVYFDVDEHTVLKVQQLMRENKLRMTDGAKVPVDMALAIDGDQYPHRALMDFVNNQIDPSTGTLQVRGILKNPLPENGGPRLFAQGMFVKVRVPVSEKHLALLVPQIAIHADQGQYYVLVANEHNIVERRPIQTGEVQTQGLQEVIPIPIVRQDGDVRPAEAGQSSVPSLTKADRVIVGGLQRIRPKMKVEIRERSSDSAPRKAAG